MDLSKFFKERLGSPGDDRRADLKREHDVLRRTLDRVKEELERGDRALAAIDGLRRCEIAGFMSNVHSHWMFVSRYETTPGGGRGRMELTSVRCVVVPEAVDDSLRHRPKTPDDPAKAAAGVVTMTPTPVPGSETAALVVAEYSANVLLGTFDDVLVEPCAACGEATAVVCEHGNDYDSECQWVAVHRLCVHCPRLEEIAGMAFDTKEDCPLLPPARRRKS